VFYFKGQEHDFKLDWGEQLVGKRNLGLNVLDLESGDINTLDTIPSDLSVGQVRPKIMCLLSPEGQYFFTPDLKFFIRKNRFLEVLSFTRSMLSI
jgi:hypothetical protein